MGNRLLFWISYDGSKFAEMATGQTGYGVMDLLGIILRRTGIMGGESKLAPSSRTDSGVHALRNTVICHMPDDRVIERDDTQLLLECNHFADLANPGGLRFLSFHPVAPGFCGRRNVAYRNYSWILPPGLDVARAEECCRLFEGTHNMASFYKHPLRERRREPQYPNTFKVIMKMWLSRGEAYSVENDLYDYYNVSIVSRSFLREQIRRMMSCVVLCSYGILPLSTIQWLLDNPFPHHFVDRKIPVAPPQGLFLTDVVYDPRDFMDPHPSFHHPWDDEVYS